MELTIKFNNPFSKYNYLFALINYLLASHLN